MASSTSSASEATTKAFGSVMADTMAIAHVADGTYGELSFQPVAPLPIHPAAHALHYASTIFEGLKAHPGEDGAVRLFRAERHAERFTQSARQLCLPVPDVDYVLDAIVRTTAANLDQTPSAPGALYLRPVFIGTDPNIGAAAAAPVEGLFFVLASPVGDYFAGGDKALKLWLETQLPRTTPQFGSVKAGANYAMALPVTRQMREQHGVDQILFAPDGDVQETGAANVLLLREDRILTRDLDGAFLHGVTRDSLLRIGRDLGMEVEERRITPEELLAWCEDGEVALSGTAAVLASVGTLVTADGEVTVGDGRPGPVAQRLRAALLDVQRGVAEDRHGWTREVTAADA